MKVFIRSAASISPQKTFGQASFLTEAVEYIGNRLTCIEPDYSGIIDTKLIRRMSRIIKMGVAAAAASLQEAKVAMPDAIITGTAYGCLEDTEVFLKKMIQNKEEMLTPTAFIQSTHNTVSAQIALMLKCHRYNNTFVNRGFSFESAILDAVLMLEENETNNVLAGGVDEIIDTSHIILSRFGLYKTEPLSNFDLIRSGTKGTMDGEGAAFFVLTNQSSEDNQACLDAISTFYKPQSITETEKNILSFLEKQSTDISKIDLIITGMNGDCRGDEIYVRLSHSIFKNKNQVCYKHLCGEYPTSTAFALWLATNIFKKQSIPAILGQKPESGRSLQRILIYNHHQNLHHSLFLLSAC
jgi:3-oxoacyl-(acyl-carrier-protein) synthase